MAGRLRSLDLPGVAEFIKSEACRKIVVLTGAGVSTGAGIPDFRSPGGMYSTLRPELITATERERALMRKDPIWVVMKDMFLRNQFPYMEVRRPFILGTQQRKWKATISHWFFRFLEEEKLLIRLFTQNIDGLDYHTGLSRQSVCNVHGSIGRVACEACGHEVPLDDFCKEVRMKIKDIYGLDPEAPKESSNIFCPKCSGPTLKPTTVLFGASLPADFFEHARELPLADLLIVAGTSLVVSPANSVVEMVAEDCPRLVVNREPVGEDLGLRYGPAATRDVYSGARACDEVFFELIKLLGWEDKLRLIKDRLPPGNQALVKDL
uniref:Deacetylase sirtuin-type domain-containing protein n=1 Tax=Pyrodinium bahamense TaxID=73915 RepID=A0A7S0B694_9DINO